MPEELRTLAAQAARETAGRRAPAPAELTPEEREALRALGYAE